MQPAPPSTTIGAITTAAANCTAAAASGVVLTALGIWLTGLADETRTALRFGFDGVDRSLAETAAIALHNAKIAGAVLLCAALAPHLTDHIQRCVSVVLAIVLALNAAALGLAIGAYGTRALRALAPHTPLELASLSLTGGAYLHACKQRLRPLVLAAVASMTALLLVVAATLETYAAGRTS